MPWDTSDRRSRLPKNWFTVVRPDILRRDQYRCKLQYSMCTKRATQVDHIRHGDDHSYENLQAACSACHAHKSACEGRQVQLQRRALGKRPIEKHPGSRDDTGKRWRF